MKYISEIDDAFYFSLIQLEYQASNISKQKIDEKNCKKLSESISVTLIISTLLAMPAIVKGIAKGISFLLDKIRQLFSKDRDVSDFTDKIIQFADKWHHMYISVIEKILSISGIYKTAGIDTDNENRHKIAEVVYYVIIFGFGLHGGIMSVKSIWHMIAHSSVSHINVTLLESVLSVIKSKEVITFVKEIV